MHARTETLWMAPGTLSGHVLLAHAAAGREHTPSTERDVESPPRVHIQNESSHSHGTQYYAPLQNIVLGAGGGVGVNTCRSQS